MRRGLALLLALGTLAAPRPDAVLAEDAPSLDVAIAAPPTPRSAQALSEYLASPDPAIRRAAAAGLGRMGPAAAVAVTALLDLVASGDAAAGPAIEALGRVVGPEDREEATEVLRPLWERGRPDAAVALLRFGAAADPILDAVVQVAATGTPEERLSAVEALAARSLDVPGAADALATLLDDRDPLVHGTAAVALLSHRTYGPRAQGIRPPSFTDASPRLRVLALRPVEARGILAKEALPAVVARLGDGAPEVREAAAAALGAAGPYARPHVAALAALADDPAPRVRFAALVALARIGANSGEIPAALERFAADPDVSIREEAAARRRGEASDARTAEAVHGWLQDPDAGVRVAALRSAQAMTPMPDALWPAVLGRLRDPDAAVRGAAALAVTAAARTEVERAAALAPLLDDADALVRSAACAALAELPSFAPTGRLEPLLSEVDEGSSAWAAARLLVRAGPRGVDALLALGSGSRWRLPAWRGVLVGAFRHADPSLFERADVRRVLVPAWLGSGAPEDDSLAGLAAAMRRAPAEVGRVLMGTTDQDEAEAAGTLLGTSGPEGVRILVEALREEDPFFSSAIHRGLGGAPADVVRTVSVALLEDADALTRAAALRALGMVEGKLPDATVARVVAAFDDADWRVRRAALDVLGRSSLPESAILAMARRLSDPIGGVRSEARASLSSHGRGAAAAVPAALEALRAGPVVDERVGLLAFLGWSARPSDAAAAAALFDAASDPDERVARSALGSIAFLLPAHPRAVPVLAEALERSRDVVVAARALGRYGPAARPALAALERAAGSDAKDLREAASAALPAVRGDVAAWVALLVADGYQGMPRLRAIEQLADIGPPAAAALPALRKVLEAGDHVDAESRGAAAEAIRRIQASTGN